ncbi:hypothetical protein H632_c1389p1 [Helicosporidium sp. ATCC 50920]|nr:hypothetical protein H632_c1389p1 [Helicosporidium sp. ATCC 50920]|eukprot:KDD74340.1 hypothetical protein H632_c1389p1 [Helicosporidium sp. ATCC 50920]
MCLASWRLQLNAVFLAVLALPYLRGLDFARVRSSVPLLAASGVSLALHMGFWVWALHHTSLTHALLLICSTPILLTVLALLRSQPLSWGELSGTAAAALGSALLALGSGTTHASSRGGQVGLDGGSSTGPVSPSWQGDLAALLGAVAAIPYFTIGQNLRQWMPVFVYACPVTLVGAVVLASSSLLFEPVSLLGRQEAGVFGWVWNFKMTLCVLYLSVVPGIVGHTGLNTLLKYHTPLVLSLALTSESLIGSAMGWAVGVVALPGVWTWVGGAVVLASTVAVVLSQHVRERGELKRARSVEGKLAASWDLEG